MTREIEVCSNKEYVANNILDMDLESVHRYDAANEWFGAVCRKIDELFGESVTVAAKGQRSMYHGWNGANTFARKGSGLGTFDNFTAEEWEACEAIVDRESARLLAEYEELGAREASEAD